MQHYQKIEGYSLGPLIIYEARFVFKGVDNIYINS